VTVVRRAERQTLQIALYSGLSVAHDAISNSLRVKAEIFEEWKASGAELDWIAFVQHTDELSSRVIPVATVSELIRRPEFRQADIHLFEFGIAYDLFDAVFLVPARRAAAIYHNVTPLELVDNPEMRRAVERSMIQKHNLAHVGRIVSVSEYNRSDLLSLGLPPDRISVLHLPPGCPHDITHPKSQNEVVEVLFVGRFVRAKGVHDLLQAVARLRTTDHRIRLTMVGNPMFADTATRQAIDAVVGGAPDLVQIVPGVDDAGLSRLYDAADVFVIPSYHEGYCVPVVEAYRAGCQVVASDAGNLPNITAGLAQLVGAGDVSALSAAIARAAAAAGSGFIPTVQGELPRQEWRRRVDRHLVDHSRDAYAAGLQTLVSQMVDDLRASAPEAADPFGSTPRAA
jgi:glycosyltransferase involved in cell wall biosynthesis